MLNKSAEKIEYRAKAGVYRERRKFRYGHDIV